MEGGGRRWKRIRKAASYARLVVHRVDLEERTWIGAIVVVPVIQWHTLLLRM